MSGARHRQKGNRVERAIVHALQDAGFAAERVPLSGAARGRFDGDISARDWLGDHDFLIVKADRAEPLVIIRLKLATEIAAIAERAKEFLHQQGLRPDSFPVNQQNDSSNRRSKSP
jgi:Holliday junction resolvase